MLKNVVDIQTSLNYYVKIGDFAICEVPIDTTIFDSFTSNVYLYVGSNDWLILSDRTIYTVEVLEVKRMVYFCKVATYEYLNLNELICINDIDDNFYYDILDIEKRPLKVINCINGRCDKSMRYLDPIHRNYTLQHDFKKFNILSISAVAGSGKSYTLLQYIKQNKDKRILYLTFNKNLILEMEGKLKQHSIINVELRTFDSLLVKIYKQYNSWKNFSPELYCRSISDHVPVYETQLIYIDIINKFCNNIIYVDIVEYFNFIKDRYGKEISGPTLKLIWDKFTTFSFIRKKSFINKYLKCLDKLHDILLIDEIQDFSAIILSQILNDVKLPKILVGDPNQAIYEFSGAVNAFNYLSNNLNIEFYSSFRVGNPLCDIVNSSNSNCWMFSNSNTVTSIVPHFEEKEDYIYLFRSWKSIIQFAINNENVYINGNYSHVIKNGVFDNPKKGKKLNIEEVKDILNRHINNDFHSSRYKLFTIHSFKGKEYNNIRVFNDIDRMYEPNLFYVAITRCLSKLVIDNKMNI